MKKATALACAMLAAAPVFADTLPGGIETSTKENPIYYTFSNMRATRVDYTNGDIWNAAHDDIVGKDTTTGILLPANLPDGSETPMIWEYPYMGLAPLNGEFVIAFSAQTEVMDRNTIYWWFEKGAKGNSVYIHNAVIDGVMKNKDVTLKTKDYPDGTRAMGFSENEASKISYYVIQLTEEELETMELTDDPFVAGGNAFALSADPKLKGDGGNRCLDMNNYIIPNWWTDTQAFDDESDDGLAWKEVKDENGETVYDENGDPKLEPIYLKYGFASVKLDWDPTNHGSNDNYKLNNGSLFNVTRVTDVSLVEKAIAAYEDVKTATYREGVTEKLKEAQANAVTSIDAFRAIPVLYDSAKLDAILATVEAMTVDPSSVKSLEDAEIMSARVEEDVQAQVNRALALAGNGTVVTLQNMLGLRDWQDASEVDPNDNFNLLCNAYLSSNGAGQARFDDNIIDAGYPAVYVSETVTDDAKWTMEFVSGQGYRLKNGNMYIRQYGNWEPMAEWGELTDRNEEDLEEGQTVLTGVDLFTWALTDNVEEAAIFTFEGCADPSKQNKLNDSDQEILETYYTDLGYTSVEEATNTINNAHIKSIDAEGNVSWLFRDSSNADYNVVSYGPMYNRWYAESGCWKIAVETAGEEIEDGIAEIAAPAKAIGCYDLQGRRVNNPTRGLYIINGVKTLIK